MRAYLSLVSLTLLLPATALAQIALRAGQYEYTLEMNLGAADPGGKAVLDAAGFKKNTRLDCITEEQAREKDVARLFAREMLEDGGDCKMSDAKTTGNKLTFTTTCDEDGIRMVMKTEMTFVKDAFSGVTHTTMPDGQTTTMKMSARRVGECPKP